MPRSCNGKVFSPIVCKLSYLFDQKVAVKHESPVMGQVSSVIQSPAGKQSRDYLNFLMFYFLDIF